MRSFLILSMLFLTFSGFQEAMAQAPQRFNYQGIARGSGGDPLASQNIGLRISILNGSPSGTAVYTETHQTTTNAYGLYTLAIGGGTAVNGNIETINWGSDDKYIRVEIDPAGSTNYTNIGTAQLLSVPYALYASSGGGGTPGPTGPAGPAGPQGPIGPQGPAGSGLTNGTQNHVVKFTGATTAGNSQIYDNDTNVGIGVTNPAAKLHISGSRDKDITLHPLLNNPSRHQAFIAQTSNTITNVVSNGVIGLASNSTVRNYGVVGLAVSSTDTSVNVGGEFIALNQMTNKLNIGVTATAIGSSFFNVGLIADGDVAGLFYGNTEVVGHSYVAGTMQVVGSMSKGGGTFKIDHPLDPENKYLYHSFVESPDMMNVYNGNVVTNAQGEAVITLPDYFSALNKDFRYQLTVVDEHQFAQARVNQKISGNQFTIKTDKPNIEVSWQITGIRQDKFAQAHPVVPEVEKEAAHKGYYLHAAEWGQPESKSIKSQIQMAHEAARTLYRSNTVPARVIQK